jgi:hypothetical protein
MSHENEKPIQKKILHAGKKIGEFLLFSDDQKSQLSLCFLITFSLIIVQ